MINSKIISSTLIKRNISAQVASIRSSSTIHQAHADTVFELLLRFVQWLSVNSDVLYELTQILFLGSLDSHDLNKSRITSFSESVTCLSRTFLEIPIAAIAIMSGPLLSTSSSDNQQSNLDDYDEYHIISM